MKSTCYLFTVAASFALVSCSAPTGITGQEYSALKVSQGNLSLPSSLTLTLHEPGKPKKTFPTASIQAGQRIQITDQRNFNYPAAYEPASVSENGFAPRPVTPTDFRAESMGFAADLSASLEGSLVVINGTITVREFQGFSKMGGEWGQAIVNDQGKILSENRIEMPKFATFTTPVHVAVKPGGSTEFEISHPTEETKVIISFEQNN